MITNFWKGKSFVNKEFETKGLKVIIRTFHERGIEVEEVNEDLVDDILELENSLEIIKYDRNLNRMVKTSMLN